MTEEYIKIIIEEYDNWRNKQEEHVTIENRIIELEIKNWEKIHNLLQDEKVKEFAQCIDYKEKKPRDYLTAETSLYEFLKGFTLDFEWSEKELKKDEYPIYCFMKTKKPIYSQLNGRKICGYSDLYWNLQQPGVSFGPTDNKQNGKNRERFKKKNSENIIYPPKGESFTNLKMFYKVQTEYIEEALKANQKEAKKLILQKYGINK